MTLSFGRGGYRAHGLPVPRKRRGEFPGATGVMSRGDCRRAILGDDADRRSPGCGIERPAEPCRKTGFEVHACP